MGVEPIPEQAAASAVARWELIEECPSIQLEEPRRTRGTWIVEGRCGDGCCEGQRWRVHIDPHSGGTRVVATA